MKKLLSWLTPGRAVIFLFSLSGLFLFYPILFGDRLVDGTYVNLYHVTFFQGQQFLINKLGGLPLWWPAFYSGYPVNLTLDGFLNPFFLLTLKLFPALTAHNWLVFLFFLTNLLSTYAFARSIPFSRSASLAAAFTYGMSGIVMRWTGVIAFTALYPILPLSFLACLQISRGKTHWRWIWMLLLAYGWIGGFAELLVYDLFACAGWALYLLLRTRPRPGFTHLLWDGVKKYLSPVLGSLILVSPWLISVMLMIKESSRVQGLTLDQSSSMPLTLSHIIHMFLPRLHVFYGGNIPVLRLEDDVDLYVGTVAILLLILLPFVWKKTQRSMRSFFIGLCMFALLMSFRSPLYLLLHQLPILNLFRWHFKWSFLTTFAIALLTGYAFDALPILWESPRWKQILRVAWWLFGIAIVSSITLALFSQPLILRLTQFGAARYAPIAAAEHRALPRSTDYYTWIMQGTASTLVRGIAITNPWTLLAALLWLGTLCAFQLKSKRLILIIGISGCVLPWYGFLIGEPTTYLTDSPATAQFLQRQETYRSIPISGPSAPVPYRIFAYFSDQTVAELQDQYRVDFTEYSNRAWLSREYFDENFNAWFGLDGFVNHEPLSLRRVADLAIQTTHRPPGAESSYQDNLAYISSTSTAQLLGKANVKYLTTPNALSRPWIPVFTSTVLDVRVPVTVYENPFFLPRWYLATSTRWSAEGRDASLKTFVSTIDADVTLESTPTANATLSNEASTTDRLQLIEYTAGKLHLTSQTQGSRWLVFSEAGMPFWQARIDGKPTDIIRANHAYQAIRVPPGQHDVLFHYAGFWEQARISATSLFLNQ